MLARDFYSLVLWGMPDPRRERPACTGIPGRSYQLCPIRRLAKDIPRTSGLACPPSSLKAYLGGYNTEEIPRVRDGGLSGHRRAGSSSTKSPEGRLSMEEFWNQIIRI